MIQKLYTDVQNLKKQNRKCWSYVYKINKLIVNLMFPLTQLWDKSIGVDASSDVIVSLTTYPARINTVWVTIASLLKQTYKPAKVVLYLSNEQFPNGELDLPTILKKLKKRGLEIAFVEDDLKPHKKYYYALNEYKDKSVITADDDIFYPENHIESLVDASKKFPDAVICARSHDIEFMEDNDNEFLNYNSWKEHLTTHPTLAMMPVGCNGVLYKRKFFDEELFDINVIKEYSLYTDDLWLKVMELKNNIKAYNCIEEPLVYFDSIFTKKTGLWKTNTSNYNNRNDIVWKKLAQKYNIDKHKFNG